MNKDDTIGRDALCKRDFEHYCRELEIAPRVIKSRNRRPALVNMRILIARALRADGHSLPRIGRVMDKHHTTIVHYLRSDEAREARNKNLRIK